ncbi:MAG: hypothetical protein GX605_10040, partial [Chloroflexi bacterium]|nr:hypothetical protein [Chloroflexota bacterium]
MILLAGAAALDVTPPLGAPLLGYWYGRQASGLHDPLQAKALVLALDDALAAIVTVDVCLLTRQWIDESARLIQKRSGIPRERLLVACSHTHTGPATTRLFGHEECPPSYREFLCRRLADVVEVARQALRPARAAAAQGNAPGLAFNRRLLRPDGKVHSHKPGEALTAEPLHPAGPVDDAIRLLYLEDAENRQPLAVLANFALHPDTMGGAAISADYPGVLAGTLAHMLGGRPTVLFANGPCGDINHLDPLRSGEPYDSRHAMRIGQTLAAQAYAATRRLTWLRAASLAGGRESVTLRVRTPEPEQVQAAGQAVAHHSGPPSRDLVRAQSLLEVHSRAGESFTT